MDYPKSDHFDGKHFHNINNPASSQGRTFAFLKWKLFDKAKPWPTQVKNAEKPKLGKHLRIDEVYVTFINHATELIQLRNLTLLTDPVFSERTSPFTWIGPKRVRPPGMSFESLPHIDIVLISHNHYDHLDLPSLKKLADKFNPLFIVPLNNAYILKKVGIQNIVELDWWKKYEVNANQSIILTPAQHWSKRGLFDRNRSLWGSYAIKSNRLNLYFAGDSGYAPHFTAIRKRVGSIDVAILPVGDYEPRWFMHENHLNPEEAVMAHLDLDSHLSLGMQYHTFQLTNEGYNEPIEDLQKALNKYQVAPDTFVTPTNGKTVYYRQKLDRR